MLHPWFLFMSNQNTCKHNIWHLWFPSRLECSMMVKVCNFVANPNQDCLALAEIYKLLNTVSFPMLLNLSFPFLTLYADITHYLARILFDTSYKSMSKSWWESDVLLLLDPKVPMQRRTLPCNLLQSSWCVWGYEGCLNPCVATSVSHSFETISHSLLIFPHKVSLSDKTVCCSVLWFATSTHAVHRWSALSCLRITNLNYSLT